MSNRIKIKQPKRGQRELQREYSRVMNQLLCYEIIGVGLFDIYAYKMKHAKDLHKLNYIKVVEDAVEDVHKTGRKMVEYIQNNTRRAIDVELDNPLNYYQADYIKTLDINEKIVNFFIECIKPKFEQLYFWTHNMIQQYVDKDELRDMFTYGYIASQFSEYCITKIIDYEKNFRKWSGCPDFRVPIKVGMAEYCRYARKLIDGVYTHFYEQEIDKEKVSFKKVTELLLDLFDTINTKACDNDWVMQCNKRQWRDYADYYICRYIFDVAQGRDIPEQVTKHIEMLIDPSKLIRMAKGVIKQVGDTDDYYDYLDFLNEHAYKAHHELRERYIAFKEAQFQ